MEEQNGRIMENKKPDNTKRPYERKKTVRRNTILNALRMLLTVIVPFVTIPYTSRIFQAEGIGRMNFASSAVELFTLVSTLSVGTYGMREGTKVRQDRAAFSVFAQEMLLLNAAATAVSYLLFFIALKYVPSFQSAHTLLTIYGWLIGSAALCMEWVCSVYEEYAYLILRQAGVQLLSLVLLFALVRTADDVPVWAAIVVFTSVLSHIFTFFHIRTYVSLRLADKPRLQLKKHLAPVLMLSAAAFAGRVFSDVNTVLTGMLTSDYHTGIYSTAVKVNTILITCFTAMTPVFLPRIVELLEEGRTQDYRLFLKKITGLILAAGIPVVTGIEMLGSQMIILLAGDGFQEAAVTIRILAPVILLHACADVLYYNFLVPHGKEKLVLFCIVTTALLNTVLGVLLIPCFAHNGAAAAGLLSETAGLALAVFFCRREDPDIFSCLPHIRSHAAGACGIVCWCFFCTMGISGLYLQTVAAVAGSMGIYALALVALHDPVAEEGVHLMRRALRKILEKLFS